MFFGHLVAVATTGLSLLAADPISTDRPDFTETNKAVPVGVLQVESGVTASRAGSEDSLGGPELLLRYGVAKGVELRFGPPNYTRIRQGDSGFDDFYLGAKVELSDDLAVIPGVSIPSDGRFASDETTGEVIFAWGRDLDERHSIGAGFGKSLSDDSWLATVVVGKSLSEYLGAFLEAVIEGAEGRTAAMAHFGGAYRPSPCIQFDAHAGVGLNKYAPDWFVGVGFSFKR